MGETISIVADICGILGFLISIFAVTKVYKIKTKIENTDSSIRQTAKGSGNSQTATTNK